jgi:hypothetical protein
MRDQGIQSQLPRHLENSSDLLNFSVKRTDDIQEEAAEAAFAASSQGT